MHWEYTPYGLPLIIAAAVSAALAFSAWRRRSVPGATPFALLMLAVVEWSLAYALELGSADLPLKVFWVKVEYLGIVTVPVMWLAFVLQYTGREKWLTRRNAALLAIVPLVTLLLAWTNDLHGLIWSDVRLNTSGFFPLLDLTYGAWWWAHAAYSYSLLLLGTLLLIQAFIRSPHLYRRQISALLIGALAPWVGNVLYILDSSPFPHLDLTPFAFTLTGLVVAWGLFRYRLLDLVPVAREAIIEGMSDGVIMLDEQNRVVNLNPAAKQVIGRTAPEVIGQPIDIADLGLRIADLEVQGFHSEIHIPQLVLSEAEVSATTYDLRISPLYDRRGRLTGRLVVLRDITEHKRAEEALRETRDYLENLLNYANAPIIVWDPEFRITRFNHAFERLTGKHADKVLGMPIDILFPEHRREEAMAHIRRTIAGERWEAVEIPILRTSGEVRTVLWNSATLYAADGTTVVATIAQGQDITERKQAEDEIRQRTAQLEALCEVSLELTAQLGLETLLRSIVSRAVELLKGAWGGLYFYRPERDVIERAVNVGETRVPVGSILHRGEGLAGKVWEIGEPLIVDDYQHWEGRAAIYDGFPIAAVVGAPVRWGEEFLGVLNVAADGPCAFSPADGELLALFATQAAIAIRNAHFFQAERGQRELAEALEEASAALTATLDSEQVLDRILEKVSLVVSNDAANIMLIEGDQVHIVRWRGYERFGAEEFVSTAVFRISEVSNLRQMMDTGEPMVIRDTAAYLGWVHVPAQEWLRSYAAAPIVVRGQVIGFLNVDSATPGFFSRLHLEPLRAFASHAAAAIENARLYEEARQRVAELEALQRTSLQLISSLDLSAVLNSVAESALTLVGATDCHIYLYDESSEAFTFGAALWEDGRREAAVEAPRRNGLTATVARERRAVVINDAVHHPLYTTTDVQRLKWKVQAIAGFPLKRAGRVLGVFTIAFLKPHTFSEEELRALGLLADQAAIAIENARLYEETEQRATELGILYEVTTEAMTSVHLDEILNRTIATLQETLQPDDIAILLLEPETNELVIRASTGFPGGPKLVRRAIGVGIPGWVVQTGQPVLLDDVRGDERYHACNTDTRSELCVPLQVGERIIGALNLESRRLAVFSEEDLHLVSILAGHLAAVIENARLFQEIEERRMYLERVLGAAPDAVITLDARHRVVEWNTGAEKLFGYSRVEVIGRNLDDLVTSPDVLDEAVGFTQIVLSGREVPPVETVRYRKDGSPVDVIVAGSPILVEDELIGVVAVYTDITEHKQAEEALRLRAEELDALQATVLDITTPHDLPTLLQTIVERAARLLDAPGGGMYLCDPDQEQVRCVVSYNTPRDYTGTVLKYGEGAAGIVAQTGEPLIIDDYRIWSRRAAVYEEEKPFVAVVCAPMIWQGQVTGVLHVLRDVESQRFTQADLQLLTLFADHAAIAVENTRLYEQAQREIAERKRAEEALRRYAAELEARNEDLDAFAHTVAHDLKNPLGIMTGFAQVLEEDYATLPDEELRRHLNTMTRSGHKMSNIIDELLLLAGVRQMEVEMEPLDMASIVAEAQQRLAAMIEEHQVEIILPETWPVALGYGPWVEEVWVNYLSNAIRYGGQPPRVELGATMQANGMVRFWIRDNGPGLTPEEQARLFTPFTQLDQVDKGYGLGLSIVRRIVERLGGQVGVESKVGRGSVFTFTLPGIASQDNSLLSG